eukprot:TRINITY_DN1433_c0_g1_i1.p1 TRINITY_DN1433_c0_g1~~TRINITY_DN1433_c0_g1_i1.p1  ORF type:complete len:276 (+),score=105.77 TRINITY_DN1433_c0_g1_i1:59-886(+)
MALSPQQRLKLKIFGSLAVLGVSFLFILGFLLGSVNEDARQQRVQVILRKGAQITQERLSVCTKRKAVLETAASAEERLMDDKQHYEADNDQITEMVQLKKQEMREVAGLLRDCEATRSEVQEGHENLRERIDELTEEATALTYDVQSANRTKTTTDRDLKLWIRTLRLENAVLRERLAEREQLVEERNALAKQARAKKYSGGDLDAQITALQEKLQRAIESKSKDLRDNEALLRDGRGRVRKEHPNHTNVENFDIYAELGEHGNSGPTRSMPKP